MRETPAQTIQRLVDEREPVPDAAILAELSSLAALPDERSPEWNSDEPWQRALLLVALGDVVAIRKLRSGASAILDRMCFGDPGELMRGMRHSLEATVDNDWPFLARVCVDRCRSPRAGTRYWAVAELGVLRDASTLGAVLDLFEDSVLEVAEQACASSTMVVEDHPTRAALVARHLREIAIRRPELRDAALRELASIQDVDEGG